MRLKTNHHNVTKQKLSHVLQSWLPILKSDIEDLEEVVKQYAKDNPLVEIKSGFEKEFVQKERSFSGRSAESSGGFLENIATDQQSLYEMLAHQITPTLFPTNQSREIAYKIIENLDEEGYFTGCCEEIGAQTGSDAQNVERIRQRFIYLEPSGVAARDVTECFLYQLFDMEIEGTMHDLCEQMIRNMHKMAEFKSHKDYEDALRIIQSFKNPPAIDYMQNSSQIKPDFYIFFDKGNLHIELNSDYYPLIEIEHPEIEHEYISAKLKEAKNIVDSLDMRKATLKKIGLMIIDYQYDFFLGGNLKPMLLQDFAKEFGYNISTISRAISGKYLSCDRGVYELKYFFSSGQNEEVSQNSVKYKLRELIRQEDKNKPYSDQKLADLINEAFDLKLGRRTITKYRKQLDIGSSSDRKKFYKLT